ncbi:hypothetical protein AHAS_Ahas05G0251300 [Arachis hypogaea]
MTFNTLEEAKKFNKNYSKLVGFSTKIRNTSQKENEIKNQLITCNRKEKWKSNISPIQKTNSSTGVNYHSHCCYPNLVEKLKQHKQLSMFVRRTIENSDGVGIRRPSMTYQSFVAASGKSYKGSP